MLKSEIHWEMRGFGTTLNSNFGSQIISGLKGNDDIVSEREGEKGCILI